MMGRVKGPRPIPYRGKQRQCFQYDVLDRLTNATTWNDAPQGCTWHPVQGNYDEGYDYNSTTGNLSSKAGATLSYNDPAHAHAVSSTAGGHTYQYDANGNMTTRHIANGLFTGDYSLIYDAENRLVEVKKNNVTVYKFVYDGNGERVKSVRYENGTTAVETILFIGAHYEITNPGSDHAVTKFFFAGSVRIATPALALRASAVQV